MKHDDDLDRILSEEEEILPSSGFTASVMEAVRREASTPPPIPFPWKRALPGLAAAVLALVLVLVEVSALPSPGALAPSHLVMWLSVLVPILEAMVTAGGHWVVLALLLTFASVRLSLRLARAIP
jgi:hypothetical protein